MREKKQENLNKCLVYCLGKTQIQYNLLSLLQDLLHNKF